MYHTWEDWLKDESEKLYFKDLMHKVDKAYHEKIVYPKQGDIFTSFSLTPLEHIKVVILGQDPYHNEHQAHGLSFSVLCEKLPPSLKNIYKELKSDLGIEIPNHGNLTKWATEGVLLLNTVLTVEAHHPNSHQKLGWLNFTEAALGVVAKLKQPFVVILWGNQAQKYERIFNQEQHLVIKSAHPSPLSAYHGFFGSKPFSKTNEFLEKMGVKPVDWKL